MSNPTLKSLPISGLIVDQSVQRPLDPARAQRIAAELRLDALGVITVSDRGNHVHHIIDGQHRAAALRAAGRADYQLPCMVYQGLTRAEEAAMFRYLNQTRQPHIIDRFRVRVVEGDPVAVELNKVLTDHGWRVAAGQTSGTFSAVAALERIYHGANIVKDGAYLAKCHTLIAVLTAAFGHNSDGCRQEIISGLGFLILRHLDLDLRKLVTELGKFPGGPLGLCGRAKALRDLSGGNLGHAMAEIITNLHNKGRRTNRLPGWRAA